MKDNLILFGVVFLAATAAIVTAKAINSKVLGM